MEIATVEGHGGLRKERYAAAVDGGVLVAGRHSAEETFAASVGDGEIAVGKVETSVTVAMHEDESGNQRAFFQVARKLHVTGITRAASLNSTIRRSVEREASEDEDEEMGPVQRCCWATLFLMATGAYLAMMVLGAIHLHASPDTRLAIYVIVQGAAVSFNAGIGFFVMACKCKGGINLVIVLYLFNLIWNGIGWWWMTLVPYQVLFKFIIGFTVPIWVPIPYLCCMCCCWMCRSAD